MTTIAREKYEKGVERVRQRLSQDSYFRPVVLARQVMTEGLAAAGIEVEPERTTEEKLVELEAQRAAFLTEVRDLVRGEGHFAHPDFLRELTDLIQRRLGEIP